MIVKYMGGKYGQGYRYATHITKVFVKRTKLFLQREDCCSLDDVHVELVLPFPLLPSPSESSSYCCLPLEVSQLYFMAKYVYIRMYIYEHVHVRVPILIHS